MKIYFRLTQLAIGLLGLLLASYTLAEPPPETVALIEELGLIAGDKPISEHPAWQPRRVLVNLPAVFSSGMPELEQQLRKVAGEVDLVIDISGDSLPSAEKLAGADGHVNPIHRLDRPEVFGQGLDRNKTVAVAVAHGSEPPA